MRSYERVEDIFSCMVNGSDESLEKIKNYAKNDPCPLVRHEAVFAIGEMASKENVSFLKEICKEDSSFVVVHEALVAIGTIGGEEDIGFLRTFEESPIYEISESAKIGISRIKDFKNYEGLVKENTGFYIEKLFEEKTDKNEKIQILFQLMRIRDSSSIEAIGRVLLNDNCSLVRHEAGFVLGEIGDEKSVNLLKKSLEVEKNSVVLHEVLFALGTSGKKEALEAIYSFLEHEDYIVRESAKIARDRIYFLKKPYSGLKAFE